MAFRLFCLQQMIEEVNPAPAEHSLNERRWQQGHERIVIRHP
jgi:hypothetical protein